MRPSGRKWDELRDISLTPNVSDYAEGSCLAQFGKTKVLCTASLEARVPPFLKGTGRGWVTAEYGMLPRSTHSRMDREAAKGKQSGRTQEIQRLIGRSLRSAVDLNLLKENQITVDCDVINADGGTRTAAITGGYVAMYLALNKMVSMGIIGKIPVTDNVVAISCGLYNGKPTLDLDYAEDSTAQADANFVLTGNGKIIEVQGTAEQHPFSREEFNRLIDLAQEACKKLTEIQNKALKIK